MSSFLDISLVYPEQGVNAAYGATVRVRPSQGLTIERCLPLHGAERVAVDPGEVWLDAVFSSGRVVTRTLQVRDGEAVPVTLEVPATTHESMTWLNLARDPERSRKPTVRPAYRSRTGDAQTPIARGLPPAPRLARDFVQGMGAGEQRRLGPGRVKVLTERAYPEDNTQVLHVQDERPTDVLRDPSASIALLTLRTADLPGVVRVCALPGPWSEPDRQVHLALRTVKGDALPDVQMVPANPEIAAAVGFMERRDQRALTVLRERFADQAVSFMAGKQVNPLGAALGLAMLLRLGELDRVNGWSRNLWRWFPALPDGGALHAAVLLRQPEDTAAWKAEFGQAVMGAASCGLPVLTDSLRRLRDALGTLRDISEGDREVERRWRWSDRLVRAADPDDVFTTVTIDQADLPTLVGGNPRGTWRHPMTDDLVLAQLRLAFAPILAVLKSRRADLRQIPGLAVARPGYSLQGDVATPALVLALHPPRGPLDQAGLSARFGVPVRATNASPAEQVLGAHTVAFASALGRLLEPEPSDFVPPKRGTYRPPSGPNAPKLEVIDEPMQVTLCTSPDAGWPVLRDFLRKGVQQRLTVAMYDFTAKHVQQELLAALDGSSTAKLLLVLDGKTASGGVGSGGVNGPDRIEADVIADLRQQLGNRLQLVRASVGAGGAVPRAYHIKVAVADEQRMWLSSGNWQSSNLAPFDFTVPGDQPPLPMGRYNREYHVVVDNPKLARCYAGFIAHDATLGGDFAGPALDDAPELLIPDGAEPDDFAPITRFKPLLVDDRVKVTPLLTPDNFPEFVNRLLAGAERRLWLQNQYIQPGEEGDNFPEFERLLGLLGQLARKPGFDLRICLRSPDEPYRDRLLAAGIPPARIRRQKSCHAKLIVIDDSVVVGSQNLSNHGFVANRDASLAFEHAGITAYFAKIFAQDWDRASAIADDDSLAVRIAGAGGAPAGFKKVPWAAVYDSPPPAARSSAGAAIGGVGAAPIAAGPTPAAASSSLDLPLFGVEAETGRRGLERSADVAAALRASALVDPDRSRLGTILSTPSFGLGPGVQAEDLADTGWGVIWGPSVPAEVKAALRPLLDHRKAAAGDDRFFQFDYLPGETARGFLQRHAVDFGAVRTEAVPFYLLLVGGPGDIPFAFQSVLDVEYRVGRLDLPSAQAYQQYATSVVAVDQGAVPARERTLHAFGPAHPGDVPTALSVDVLVRGSSGWLEKNQTLSARHQLTSRIDAGDAATKQRLLQILSGTAGRPEVLFTAGHGLLCGAGSARQLAEQGALVTADWDGFSAIDESCCLAGRDLPDTADVHGMVAFLFACFGAGTPASDSFPTRAGQVLAAQPFVSALPQALLGHPRGAALGVFSHVDRTLVWSLQPPRAPVATDPFARAALHVLAGNRLGAALEDLNQRGASLAAAIAGALRPGAPPIDDVDLVSEWTQQRDAAAFLLLGDPAARLRR